MSTPSQQAIAEIRTVFDTWSRAMLTYGFHSSPHTPVRTVTVTSSACHSLGLCAHSLLCICIVFLVRLSDAELIASLWADDSQYRISYLLPGHPALHSVQDIHARATALMASFRVAGITASTFDMEMHCDPSAVNDPRLISMVGVQSITMGGKTEKSHGIGAMVKVGGQWKILSIGVVNTTPMLHAMVDELSK